MPKGADNSLGRAILKDKAAGVRSKKQEMHNRKKMEKAQAGLIPDAGLKSILDVNNLDDFLDTIALSQRNFETTKGMAVIIDRDVKEVVDDFDPEANQKYRTMQIPRRRKWDMQRSPEEQDRLERMDFLEWRRNVAKHVEHETGAVAPFEKNLEVWRQLWRVVERSDLLVQIVDSRNPLLFRCPDVDVYVKEVHPCKQCVLIVNKADLIPEYVRYQWGRYFDSINLPFVFFSAKASSRIIEQQEATMAKEDKEKKGSEDEKQAENNEEVEEESEESEEEPTLSNQNAFASLAFDDSTDESDELTDESSDDSSDKPSNDSNEPQESHATPTDAEASAQPSIMSDIRNYASEDLVDQPAQPASAEPASEPPSLNDESALEALHCSEEERNRYRIYSREEVLSFLESKTKEAYESIKAYELEHGNTEWVDRRAVVGMIGFPNVGKSSLINVLLGVSATTHGAVRVAVAATPGKTKHLQTVVLSDTLMLCDCPGLVFPVFMNTKADLLFNGILPASNMRDYIGPIRLVCQRVKRSELERVYHIKLLRHPLDPPNAVPHPRQLLAEVCKQRGYMASNHSGVNEPRGAIVILKDVLNGVLRWWIPPPNLGVIPENPIASFPEQKEAMDPNEMSAEMLAEMPSTKENGGRHKPRVRNVKERSAKKNHKNKNAIKHGEAQYKSTGAFQYV